MAEKFDARLAEGVAYFEQMLAIMPDDRTTLEFLVVAYEQLNEPEKQKKALISLAKLLIKEGDSVALEGLLPRLEALDVPEAKVLVLKIKTMIAPQPELVPEAPKELTEEEIAIEVARQTIKTEVCLVGLMQKGGVLSEEEANSLKEQLEAIPCDGRYFLISALQILEKENATLSEKCVAFVADQYGAPPIPLGSFEVPRDAAKGWPAAVLRIKGVVPFAKIGKIQLMAVLNPGDEEMKAQLNAVGPCRFYLADPAAIEAALGKLFAPKA